MEHPDRGSLISRTRRQVVDVVAHDGTYGATKAHEVRANDPQTESQEEGDLVAPCKGQIRPAVDLDIDTGRGERMWR